MSSSTAVTTSKVANGSINGSVNGTPTPQTNGNSKNNKRIELENIIRELQNKLGSDWDKYHESLSLFLIGKLSRQELVNNVVPILKNGLIKYHNKLLLLNFANSFRDIPIDFQNDFATFWNKKAKTKTVKSSQYEKFKQNIMGLPIKERRRIRGITRDSGKKNKINAGITLTRHALLPKIPSIQDKEQQQLQVNNIVSWQQDVVNGINAPISTETFELPDTDDLSKRVIMMMRESGLTGNINPQVLDILMLGLETYLKNIIESSVDVARFRETKYSSNDFLSTAIQTVKETFEDKEEKKQSPKKPTKLKKGKRGGKRGRGRGGAKTRSRKNDSDDDDNDNESDEKDKKDEEENDPKRRKVTLNIDDMYNTFEMFPYLADPGGPKYRLNSVMLKNDDEPIDDLDYKLPKFQQSYLASVNKEETESQSTTDTVPNYRAHIGTTDELKWVVHDLYSKM
ncbi:transcriptional coactivator Hfi1p/ADA1 [[Candida] jaroonii]|uniref:Transcriptional coactivator Hfi1p/ADA1 n=1 Tax=[Candida] jaroonii TaxID=467808 RepID=A0ACA9Y5D7_9ASCO|nr:transcriptional coactivator Hfi1p/ADA1 [[Candida] jaroonii]